MGYVIAFLCIILVLLPLFVYCRIVFLFSSSEDISVVLKVLFLKFDLLKEKKKKASPEKSAEKNSGQAPKDKQKEQKKEKLKLNVVLKIIKDSIDGVRSFLGKLKIRKMAIDISVGSPDAAKTAIDYGVYNAAVGAIVAAAESFCDIKYKRINIFSNFTSEKTEYQISFEIKGRIIHILKLGINLVKNIYLNMNKTKGEKKDEQA